MPHGPSLHPFHQEEVKKFWRQIRVGADLAPTGCLELGPAHIMDSIVSAMR